MGKSKRPVSVLDEVLRFNADRKRDYLRLKLQKMAHDPFAFFRGSDHLFAGNWPALAPPDPGPSILLCGDLHVENFGAYRTEDGKLLFDVNDFDEALVGPCSLDLVRCTTSILLASEMWKRTPLEATRLALEYLERYRKVVTSSPHRNGRDPGLPTVTKGPIFKLLGKAALADEKSLLGKLTTRSATGERTLLVSEDKHPAIGARKSQRIKEAFDRYRSESPDQEFYRVLDVTGRILGIGSLGVRRFLVLVAGTGGPNGNRLLDVKEALPSSLRSCADAVQPKWDGGEAVRVAKAQAILQGQAAARLDTIKIGQRGYRIREMIPEESRPKIDRFKDDPAKLVKAIRTAGELTGALHIRGARFCSKGQATALAKWGAGPALDAVLASAARHAERTLVQFDEFRGALSESANLPKSLQTRSKRTEKDSRR